MATERDPLEQLAAALDALAATAPDALAGRDDVVALHRQLSRLEAVTARASAAFERTRAWEADGARTASAWLATRCLVPDHVARRRLQAGRALPVLPTTEAAWLAGDSGSSAVEQLATARNETTADQLQHDEPELVRFAGRPHPRAFARLVGHWRTAADPDGVDADARRLHDDRRVHLSSTFEGAWVLDGVLDPVGVEILHNALSTVTRDLFRSDWAEAKAADGDHATTAAARPRRQTETTPPRPRSAVPRPSAGPTPSSSWPAGRPPCRPAPGP